MKMLMHYNMHLKHQRQHAYAFIRGCSGLSITDSRDGDADIHIISGPHFALSRWKHHPRVLMIDRAYWGDPDYVSIGWLQDDGSRKFATGDAARKKPGLYDWKPMIWDTFGEIRCTVLADYGQDVSAIVEEASKRFLSVSVRLHPADAEVKRLVTLEEDILWSDVVIGTAGTSIFEAIKLGVPVICLDPLNPIAPVCSDSIHADLYRGERDEWLHDMSYKQWSLDEIASGEAWSYLKDAE